MSDHGGEEARGLLEEPVIQDCQSSEYDVEPKDSPSRRLRGTPKRFWAKFLIVTLILTLPLLNYMRHEAKWNENTDAPAKQLAIPLYPERHVSRPVKTLELHWNVTLGAAAPDGVEKLVYLVNDAFPGPTIEARSGDRVIIHVHNGLELEGLSLHWHGLQMRGFNSMDGAVGFTQCPIPAGEDFTYDYTIGENEHGTFWWHSHSQFQRGDGLYGGLVVHQPGDKPRQKEALLLVGDWFHRKQSDVSRWYFDWGSLGNEPVPDSVLVNGRGRYNCSMAVPARPVICNQLDERDVPPLLEAIPKEGIKMRFVNTGTVSGVTVAANATMLPVGVDGGFAVQAKPGTSVGILYPGERADFLVTWANDVEEPYLHITLDDENFGGFPNPALDLHHIFPILKSTKRRRQGKSPSILANDGYGDLAQAVAAATPTDTLTAQAQETLVLYFKTQILSRFQNKPLGFVNRTSWKPQSPPLLAQKRTAWNDDQFVPLLPLNVDVDLVINNLDDGSHPVHLHGHSFYVLSSYKAEGRSGWGSYNPYEDEPLAPKNVVNPLRKDTVSVPRRGHVVIRVKTNNVGIWMMHCHMLVHMGTGMAMGLQIGEWVDVAAGGLCKA